MKIVHNINTNTELAEINAKISELEFDSYGNAGDPDYANELFEKRDAILNSL